MLSQNEIEETFKNILLSYYKENLYQESEHSRHFIIHYPEIIIQNSVGRSHKIYDLFVKLTVSYEGNWMFIRFEGTRISFSQKEVEQGYCHSHLSQAINYSFNFTDFCLGTGHLTHYNKIKIETNCDILYTLPAAIDRYVEWESLEGGPYRKISSLENSHSSTVAFSSPADKLSLKKNAMYQKVQRDAYLGSNLTLQCNVGGNLPVYGIKIGNIIYSSENVPIPDKNNEETFDVKKMGTVNLIRVLDKSDVTFDCKKITKSSLNRDEEAQVVNLTDFLIATLSLHTPSVEKLIKNKKNEFIQFT